MVNWAFLLLAMGGLRLALENINKYGIRVNLTGWIETLLFHLTHNQVMSMRKKCILSIVSEFLGRIPHPLPHPLHKCPRPPDLAPGEVDSQGHLVLADGDVSPHDQPVPDARHPHRGD